MSSNANELRPARRWFQSEQPTLEEICEPDESLFEVGWVAQNAELARHADELFQADPPPAVWRDAAHAAELADKFDSQATAQVRGPYFQKALDLHAELTDKRGPGYLDRARTRHALANYLRHQVTPWAREHGEPDAAEYALLADKLENARPWGVYGVDLEDESLAVEWMQRAGLVKLCPDDARDEGGRVARRYAPMLELLQEEGLEVQFAVFTIPNVPAWHLGAGLDAIFNRFRREVLYARTDGRQARSIRDKKRLFPELVGALAVLEAPLSAKGDWNVHLNVLMVFDGRPDWKAYREAWGANVEFRRVPAGASDAALRELIKYPLKAVAQKSAEKARPRRDRRTGELIQAAPPTIEWHPERFVEWWRAHKGFRRTRSWGVLYAGNVPAQEPRSLDHVEWMGKMTLTPARFAATPPMPDTRASDALQAARARSVDLIQGNKSAGFNGASGPGPPLQ